MAVEVKRYAFTVDEFHRMARAGIFAEDERVELIEGDIIEMTPIGPEHSACVDRLTEFFITQLRGRAIVRVQSPIRLGERSEPVPDLAVLRRREDFYRQNLPGPDDTLLVIEVSDTSLAYDQQVKIPLYGRSGIPEAWVVDLNGRTLTAYRQPHSQGYRQALTFGPDGAVAPLAFPDLALNVGWLLG